MAAAGGAHSLATTAGGRVYAFGDGRQGQLGVEPPGHATAMSATGHRCCVLPAWVEALAAISPRAVACGGDFSLVVAHDGSLYSFGANSFGRRGRHTHALGEMWGDVGRCGEMWGDACRDGGLLTVALLSPSLRAQAAGAGDRRAIRSAPSRAPGV